MEGSGFTRELRTRTDAIWSAIHRHPFVRAIGEGTISPERLAFYLRQDHAYLEGFSRAIALAATRAPDVAGMRFLSSLLEATLGPEMDLHRRICAARGIGPEELAAIEPGLVTLSYTSFLIRTGHEGSFGEVLAVLLPCATGYVEVAVDLGSRARPEHPWCRDWIETYSGEEMRRTADHFAGWFDGIAAAASGADRRRFEDLYRASARYELLFLDAAWHTTAWPDSFRASRSP